MTKEDPSATKSRGQPDFNAYEEYLVEREEILRHKWLESEKAGMDISWESALVDWITRHRRTWLQQRKDARLRA